MMLSKNTISVLVDMIENKLALMQISDREELREVMTLQRCLSELRGAPTTSSDKMAEEIPTRGRHRKLTRMMDDFDVHPQAEQQRA